MATVVWTDRAIQPLEQIVNYVNAFDPGAARRMAARLVAATTSLRHFPQRGRPVRHGYRELPSIRPSIIIYDIQGDSVTILDIRHGAQRQRDV
ncbi:type II toxin-antitoxin system RelE/ParE family toxin [Sphingomonas yunnanensis]|uniref:type II toxin-antitoxin system RelE/ParE family toxin n=1 Tax=Sphingomonas yunnanensis TaxID=310400 RepID=UPI001CA713BB|nr:type II toxin-antitoxin system RelE/ParE family toxin [Sphingomonas yunnanensis]MBY9063926.1 type II toxin-antitoxin system RelE/ParE family toxin [Sphingomonas yunnanensis]